MYFKAKVTTCLFILGLIFGVYGVFITNYSDNEVKGDNDQEVNEISNLKSSQWLVYGISIDDTDVGNTDWFTINETNPWCNGAGTWDDPYIIEDVYVDGQGDNSDGIVIQNSDVPFIINNTDVYNIGTTGGTGIYLNNVNNSLITNCVVTQCGDAGITMEGSCNNNTIGHTISLYNNQEEGIYIDLYGGGTDIVEFSFNNISSNSIVQNGKEGIMVDIDFAESSKLYFYNNSFTNNFVYDHNNGDGIDFIAYTGDDARFHMSNNSFNDNGLYENHDGIEFEIEAEGTSIINFNFTTFLNNRILDNTQNGINIFLEAKGNSYVSSKNNTIAENVLGRNEINGVQIDGGEEDSGVVEWNDNLIINNSIGENKFAGIALVECSDFTLRKNLMYLDGLAIASENLGHASSHDIDTTNEVNDKPIYYFTDRTGLGPGPVPNDYPNAGQIILVNCNDSLIYNVHILQKTVFGISIGWGKNNTIYMSDVDDANYAGIALYKSHENNISTNEMFFCDSVALYVDKSNYNNITNNNIWANEVGIILDESVQNNITDNSIQYNVMGIYFDHSNYTSVINNTFKCNNNNWVELDSHDNILAPNTFLLCPTGGDGDDDDDDDDDKDEVIPGYDLFIFISTIFILLGVIYVILVKKRLNS